MARRRGSRALGAVAALLTCFAIGCRMLDDLVYPVPSDAIPLAPSAQYALWWTLTESCSGFSGDMYSYHWYVIPGASSIDGGAAVGQTDPVTRRIVLAGKWAQDGGVVRHEMLHALGAVPGHPAKYFQQKCGGIVDCPSRCVADGGAPARVDSLGPVVRTRDLVVSASAVPAAPSMSQDSGWFELLVQIHNPNPFAVRLRLQPIAPNEDAAATFGYDALYCDRPYGPLDPAYFFVWDTTIVMAPGETRQQAFDLHAARWCLRYRPFFNDDSLADIRVEATP